MGARPGRKETLPPWALPGIAAGTEGRLAADTNTGGQPRSPGAPSHPTGTQREEETGSWWKRRAARQAGTEQMCYGNKEEEEEEEDAWQGSIAPLPGAPGTRR